MIDPGRVMTEDEQRVYDMVLAALELPLLARVVWFEQVERGMQQLNQRVGWDGKHVN